ncbi:MAG TPA: MmgE/PrpD family protein [Streptosporangiaceae bacterium]|nr:MmgE/PrpD family protein [Streptosporangiaceae bacterium]
MTSGDDRTGGGFARPGSPPEVLGGSLVRLGEFVSGLAFSRQETAVRAALERIVFDSLAVTMAGGRLPESHRLRRALPLADGPATVFGQDTGTGAVEAAWLNGVSMVCLELDEGNKLARGHASAHVIPAALALAETKGCSGEDLASALLAGHEVASRFGYAAELTPGIHPHGNWGVAGAAAAASRLLGHSPAQVAAAIDAAGALALVTPFRAALAGMNVRNAWIGHAGAAGIHAAAIGATQTEPLAGIAADTFGIHLGSLSAEKLTADLGSEYAVTRGYFKRHASCSYTHPPADAVLGLICAHGPVAPDDIDHIRVETHRLAAGLTSTRWPTRLATMFSIPYVVAIALIAGECGVAQFGDSWRGREDVASLAAKVTVAEAADLTARLPAERAARLQVRWASGAQVTTEVSNPVGDADHSPFTDADLLGKAAKLLGSEQQAAQLRGLCAELLTAGQVTPVLARLRTLAASAATAPCAPERLMAR